MMMFRLTKSTTLVLIFQLNEHMTALFNVVELWALTHCMFPGKSKLFDSDNSDGVLYFTFCWQDPKVLSANFHTCRLLFIHSFSYPLGVHW